MGNHGMLTTLICFAVGLLHAALFVTNNTVLLILLEAAWKVHVALAYDRLGRWR